MEESARRTPVPVQRDTLGTTVDNVSTSLHSSSQPTNLHSNVTLNHCLAWKKHRVVILTS